MSQLPRPMRVRVIAVLAPIAAFVALAPGNASANGRSPASVSSARAVVPPGQIAGTVVDDQGAPIVGAVVQASPVATPNQIFASTTSDGAGAYLLTGLDAGEFYVHARSAQPEPAPQRPRWLPSATSTTVASPVAVPDVAGNHTITLPRSASVSGRLLGLTGELLASARLTLSVPPGSSTAGPTITNGNYTLTGLEPGPVTITLETPGPQNPLAAAQTRSVTVGSSEQVTGFDLQYQQYVYGVASAGTTTVIWNTNPSSGTPLPTSLPTPITIDASPTPRFAPGSRTLKVDRKGWLVRPLRCPVREQCDGTLVVMAAKHGATGATELGRAAVLAKNTVPFDGRVRLSAPARKRVAKAGRKGLPVTLHLLGDDGTVASTAPAKLVAAR